MHLWAVFTVWIYLMIRKPCTGIRIEPSSLVIAEGNPANFTCIPSNPDERIVQWTRTDPDFWLIYNGRDLLDPNLFTISRGSRSSSTLGLKSVQTNSSGLYSCSASGDSTYLTASAELVVLKSPMVCAVDFRKDLCDLSPSAADVDKVYPSGANDLFFIICSVKFEKTLFHHFEWTRSDNRPFSAKGSVVREEGDYIHLKAYIEFDFKDSGLDERNLAFAFLFNISNKRITLGRRSVPNLLWTSPKLSEIKNMPRTTKTYSTSQPVRTSPVRQSVSAVTTAVSYDTEGSTLNSQTHLRTTASIREPDQTPMSGQVSLHDEILYLRTVLACVGIAVFVVLLVALACCIRWQLMKRSKGSKQANSMVHDEYLHPINMPYFDPENMSYVHPANLPQELGLMPVPGEDEYEEILSDLYADIRQTDARLDQGSSSRTCARPYLSLMSQSSSVPYGNKSYTNNSYAVMDSTNRHASVDAAKVLRTRSNPTRRRLTL